MLNHSRRYFKILCLLLTFHVVALNTCEKFYLNLLTQSSISKDFDIEEDSDSKTKSNESDSFIDDYIVEESSNYWKSSDLFVTENLNKISFNSPINSLQIGVYEIDTPPPRA
jgi:hypothetical protein